MFTVGENKWVIKKNVWVVEGSWTELWQVQRGWVLSMLIFIFKGIITQLNSYYISD